jgi:hypothetical protein
MRCSIGGGEGGGDVVAELYQELRDFKLEGAHCFDPNEVRLHWRRWLCYGCKLKATARALNMPALTARPWARPCNATPAQDRRLRAAISAAPGGCAAFEASIRGLAVHAGGGKGKGGTTSRCWSENANPLLV